MLENSNQKPNKLLAANHASKLQGEIIYKIQPSSTQQETTS